MIIKWEIYPHKKKEVKKDDDNFIKENGGQGRRDPSNT